MQTKQKRKVNLKLARAEKISTNSTEKKQELNFYEFELLDRTSIIVENFNKYIVEHFYVKEDKVLKKVTEEISESLMDLYQYLGQRFFDSSKSYLRSPIKSDAKHSDLDEI